MHVYHYSAAEPSVVKQLMAQHATREVEVDDLLRRGVFVDLLTVTRQALRAGVRSYSLKQTERLAGLRAHGRHGRRLGCRARLRALARQRGPGRARRDRGLQRGGLPRDGRAARLAARRCGRRESPGPAPIASVRAGRGERRGGDGARRSSAQELIAGEPEGSARWLAGELLEYHRREARPAWWRYFALPRDGRAASCSSRQRGARGARAGRRRRGTFRASYEYDLRFPAQEHKIEPGDVDRSRRPARASTSASIDDAATRWS